MVAGFRCSKQGLKRPEGKHRTREREGAERPDSKWEWLMALNNHKEQLSNCMPTKEQLSLAMISDKIILK